VKYQASFEEVVHHAAGQFAQTAKPLIYQIIDQLQRVTPEYYTDFDAP
jgi:hypothetical protein